MALAGGRGYQRAHVRHTASAAARRLAVIAWREETGLQASALEFSDWPSAYVTLFSIHQPGSALNGDTGHLCSGVEACRATADDAEVVGL